MAEITILTVDDNDAGRYATGRILRAAGFTVLEAGDGESAIGITERLCPSLVLLDVNLPDMQGFEVCRRLKANQSTSCIPVVLISASFIKGSDQVRGLEGGADAYLTEPLEPEVLIATVNALLRVRRAEEQVRQSSRQWQSTFNAISDGVAVLDLDGSFRQSNRAMGEILGRSEIELAASDCADLFGPLDGHSPLARMLGTRKRESVEIERDGRWLQVTFDPLFDEREELTGAVCIVSDISDRIRVANERAELLDREQAARIEAENASRAKDQFLAVLSHELRTPLTPILTLAHYLETEPRLPEEMRPIVEIIHRNIELEARLIDDLLDLNRIARGKLSLAFERVDASSVIESVVQMCAEDVASKQQALVLELAAEQHSVHADPARLQQVFWNLLKNAIKFTPEGGRIRIRSSNPTEGVLQVSVIDTGIGIDPVQLPRIFDSFEQGDPEVARKYGGLGLGLSISRSLVERHGGRLTATSAGEGEGSAFVVELETVPA